MAGLEANLVISASDRTSAAFASVETRVKALDRNVGQIAKAVDAVDKIATSVAPISSRLDAVASQVTRVTAATRGLVAEEQRLAQAGERLQGFRQTTSTLEALEKQLGKAQARMREAWNTISQASSATGAMQTEFSRAENAVKMLSTAIERQSEQVAAARVGFEELAFPLDNAAAAEQRLAAEVRKVNAAMAEQGRASARASEELAKAVAKEEQIQKRRQALMHQFNSEVLPFAGPLMLEGVKSSVEQAAEVEQLRFRVRELSRNDPSEAPFADSLADEVAAKYPAIGRGKALDTYLELRANAAGENGGPIDQAKARNNLMVAARAQTAALALGFEMTPVDMQNLLKSVEGSGRAGDPRAVEKISDAYIRAKQVFGTAIASDMLRDYTANAKSSNFSIGDDQFYLQNMVRMSEGNASRLGNEVNQTMASLAGGAMKKQAGLWFVAHGLANADQVIPTGGGNVMIKGGLKDSATLQTNQGQWAATTLRKAIEDSGALSDAKIKARSDMLRADALKRDPSAAIDERFLRQRAEEGLIAAELAKSGLRSTVTDNLAHLIGNERLIDRDTGQLLNASGSGAADRLGQNPVAAFKELTDAISNFAGVVAGPAISKVGPALDALAHAVADFAGFIGNLEKEHPMAATGGSFAALLGGLGVGGYLSWKLISGFGSMLSGGNGVALTGSASALGGAATALDGAAAALDGAAARLGAGAGPMAPMAAGWLGGLFKSLGMLGAVVGTTEYLDPNGNFGGLTSSIDQWFKTHFGFDPSNVQIGGGGAKNPGAATPVIMRPLPPEIDEMVNRDYDDRRKNLPLNSPESRRGAAMDRNEQQSPVKVDVAGEAQAEVTVRVEPSSTLLEIIDRAQRLSMQIALHDGSGTGRMDADAAPKWAKSMLGRR